MEMIVKIVDGKAVLASGKEVELSSIEGAPAIGKNVAIEDGKYFVVENGGGCSS